MRNIETRLDELFAHADKVGRTNSDDQETQVGALSIPGDRFWDADPKETLAAANSFIEGAKGVGLPAIRPGKYQYMVHAETNLTYLAARWGKALIGSIVICTLSPCHNCLRALWQAGVSEIYFRDIYKDYNCQMDDLHLKEEKVGKYTKLTLLPINQVQENKNVA